MTPSFADGEIKLIERIGRGSFGQVYRAIHVPSTTTIAVKVLDLDTYVLFLTPPETTMK